MTIPSLIPTLLASGGNKPAGLWLPERASTMAGEVDWIFFLIYWICVFFFVLIVVLMVIFVVKWRRVPGRVAEATATHHTALEVTWTVIPLILVVVIFYTGLRSYLSLVTPPQNAYEVNVTGQKWTWSFRHPNGAIVASELDVPAGRPVKLIMRSEDVGHSVYIPAFRVKQDVVAGRYTYLWFEAQEPKSYQLFCAEYCGTDHSQMTAMVNVWPAEEFDQVIADKADLLKGVGDEELYKAGFKFYPRCQSCHTLDGSTKIGPSFQQTHSLWGQTRTLKDGTTVTIDENYIRSSILNPGGQIVENFTNQMPSFQGQLKEREIDAIIQFIKRLDEVVDANGNPLP